MPNSKLRFCLNFTQERPLQEVITWWKACDDAGIHVVGLPDSPLLLRELYVTATLCAMNTSRIQVLSSVTNPVTRHPAVTASAFFSLDELAPGRIAMGISTGDSVIWSIKQKPASPRFLREYILAVKALLRGEEASYQGKTFKAAWSAESPPKNIPIYVACSGPRNLRMASQVADGLIITMGFAPEDIQYVRGLIEEACAEVGRNPDDLDVWWNASISFAPSVEEAMENSLGWNLSWLTMGTLEGKRIPEEYRAPLVQMNEDTHNLSSVYIEGGRGRALVRRAKELGIYDWVISRSPRLWGTPEDINVCLAELAELGVTNWQFVVTPSFVGGPRFDRFDLIDKLSKQVIPNFA